MQGVPGASIAQTLQALNSKIAVEGQDAKSVAKEYSRGEGLPELTKSAGSKARPICPPLPAGEMT